MKAYQSEVGNASIILLVILMVLLGAAGLVLDMGVVYLEKVKLINALDAAALAGAIALPDDPEGAKNIAKTYLEYNNVEADAVIINVNESSMELTLAAEHAVPHFFMKLMGVQQSVVHGKSTVAIGPASSVSGGVRPFAVEDFPYSYGDLIILKEDGGDGYHGNYGAVAMGGTGASVLMTNAIYGYDGVIRVGDGLPTEPGNMAMVTNALRPILNNSLESYDNYSEGSFRLWTVPVVDTLTLDGRGMVTVIGFAKVFVETMEKKGGQVEIEARFLKFVLNGEVDFELEDHGTYAAKLIE